jgi:VanZ family protein
MPTRIRPWRPALVWAAVLFGLSSIPGTSLPEVPGTQTDKLVHGTLYLVLGALCARALRRTWTATAPRMVLLATLLATLYGVTDELHQLLTPRRSCDWHDALADAVGGLLGALLATSLARRHNTHAVPHGGNSPPAL